ncbi:MAG TPA: exodeoxyribonuclease VII small subunit [Coriobacteriia bacterium]
MADESYSFNTARTRLEEIVSQVRKKDTSLEKSLDLLEEGVRLANACTELIDHQDWVDTSSPAQDEALEIFPEGADETVLVEGVAVIEDIVIEDEDGTVVAEVTVVSEDEVVGDFESADDAWADESAAETPDDADDPSAAER